MLRATSAFISFASRLVAHLLAVRLVFLNDFPLCLEAIYRYMVFVRVFLFPFLLDSVFTADLHPKGCSAFMLDAAIALPGPSSHHPSGTKTHNSFRLSRNVLIRSEMAIIQSPVGIDSPVCSRLICSHFFLSWRTSTSLVSPCTFATSTILYRADRVRSLPKDNDTSVLRWLASASYPHFVSKWAIPFSRPPYIMYDS